MEKKTSFRSVTENRLKKILDFNPVEKLGQNFLVDPAMVKAVVASTIEV